MKNEKRFFMFRIKDNKDLKMRTINQLPAEESVVNALKRNDILTMGNLISRWDEIDSLKGIGKNKASKVRASFFAFVTNHDFLLDCDLV